MAASSNPACAVSNQVQMGQSQPVAEVKLLLAPRPFMYPHFSQLPYLFQEGLPAEVHGNKPDTTTLFLVNPEQGCVTQTFLVPQSHESLQPVLQRQHSSSVSYSQPSQVNQPEQLQQHQPQQLQEQSQAEPSEKQGTAKRKSSANECLGGNKNGAGIDSSSSKTTQKRYQADGECRCKNCGKVFSQPHHLTRHIRIHTGEQPFKCDMCERTFSDESHCLRHWRLHVGIRNHRCDECGKQFFENNQLRRHYKLHRGERPWRCNQCDKAFCDESGLKKHLQSHTTERPFKCQYCERGFLQRSELSRHVTSHTGNKMFKCDVCEKAYARKYSLNKHMRSHLKDSSPAEPNHSSNSPTFWSGFSSSQ